jgi:pimeloyl-ACP methyl ester carboxylesterase
METALLAAFGLLITLLALGALYQRVSARQYRRRCVPPGRLIDLGGHRLHVVCHGSGTPLVLLEAGIAASSLSWAVVQPAIAALTRVCAYDRAGLAWSEPPSREHTFQRVVDELEAVLTHVAPNERYLLVGHSFGSFVVRAYATRFPQRVAGLVLVDPAVEWLTMTPARARLLRGGRRLSKVGALLAHLGIVRGSLALLSGGAPAAPRRLVQLFGPTAARTLERLVGEVRKLPSDLHPVVQELWCQPKCFHAMAEHLLILERDRTSIAAVQPPREIPVVVISSGDRTPDELDAHRALVDAAAYGRHVVAAQSTHWVQFDQPQLIVEAVKALLDSA